jgi:hypothetical protein
MLYDKSLFIQIAKNIKDSHETTLSMNLKKVSFKDIDNRKFIAIEQNPLKVSKWADLAKKGYNVVQIISEDTNQYVAAVVNGKVTIYNEKE